MAGLLRRNNPASQADPRTPSVAPTEPGPAQAPTLGSTLSPGVDSGHDPVDAKLRMDALRAAADAGDNWFAPERVPELTPNFLYDLVAPGWAENNQLVRVDYSVAARLATMLQDSPEYIDDIDLFTRLADRTVDTPMRSARLRKLLIDAVNGLPDDDGPSLFDRLASEHVGHSVRLKPTRELIEAIYRHAFGWGPLEPLMADKTLTEIMVNRSDGIFVERTLPGVGAVLVQEPLAFESPQVLAHFIQRMVEQTRSKKANFENPLVDMTLPDGSRVNITIPPVSRQPSITIRRKREEFYSLDELERMGSFSAEMHEFFHESNLAELNLITYGPTGSGKTTLLTALLDDKPGEKRLVIVEDTAEININVSRHSNTIWLLTSEYASMRNLVKNALRMRPDHLIVGETRDHTAYDLIQAFNTGQAGSMSTLHARDPKSALTRLTNLVRQAEAAPTEEPARRMVADAIHLLVYAARLADGTRRIFRVDEVLGVNDKGDANNPATFDFLYQNIFTVDIGDGRRNDKGRFNVAWKRNPDYVMGPEAARMFLGRGYDPDKWTGEKARAEGRTAQVSLT